MISNSPSFLNLYPKRNGILSNPRILHSFHCLDLIQMQGQFFYIFTSQEKRAHGFLYPLQVLDRYFHIFFRNFHFRNIWIDIIYCFIL